MCTYQYCCCCCSDVQAAVCCTRVDKHCSRTCWAVRWPTVNVLSLHLRTKKNCLFLFSILQHKAHSSFDSFALVPLPLMFFFINQRAQPQKRSRVTFEFIMLRGIRGFNTFSHHKGA